MKAATGTAKGIPPITPAAAQVKNAKNPLPSFPFAAPIMAGTAPITGPEMAIRSHSCADHTGRSLFHFSHYSSRAHRMQ